MKLPRRKFLHLAAGVAALPAVSRIARAQAYPTRPVHIIVGYAPAGGTDIFARLLGQSLSERFGQPFVIDNRPGASTNIATEAVARAPADGYTLLGTDAAAATNAALYENLTFNFIGDIAVVGMIRAPLIMMVHPAVPATTVPEFITYAKANPGKVVMGSAGLGNPSHLAGELFKAITHIDMTHVPYRGAGPATTDLLGGQVQVLFNSVPASIEYIRSGRLRALAVTTAMRLEAMPDLPTMGDFLPGYDASQWYAIGLRKSTSMGIIDILNKEINTALAEPKLMARLADLGTTVFPGTSAEYGKFVAEETEKWAKVIRAANIKLG
jgi:tripartite-type tricarboxylate transporter receptor subunit TctC